MDVINLSAFGRTWLESTPAVAWDTMLALSLVAGVPLWCMGGRLARPTVVTMAFICGAVVGFIAGSALGSTPAAAVAGTFIGAGVATLAAWSTFRLWSAGLLAAASFAVAPAIVLATPTENSLRVRFGFIQSPLILCGGAATTSRWLRRRSRTFRLLRPRYVPGKTSPQAQ